LKPPEQPLSDNEAHDALHEAKAMLASRTGATARSETALRAGEKMLHLLMTGLVLAAETETDDPTAPPPSRP